MKFMKILLTITLSMLNGFLLFSQVAVNTDGSQPASSAMLDVKSTTKGFLPPRMTHAEINSIIDPADGLIIYCTDCGAKGSGAMSMRIAGKWETLSSKCLEPLSPVGGTHTASKTQIIWNWNTVSDATGYKWNTTNDYGSATDLLTATSKTESGLVCNTPYTRYAWAYNTCGNSVPVALVQTTNSCFDLPALSTSIVSAIAQNTARSGGEVSSDGGASVTAKGVCWSTTSNPTTLGSHTTDGSGTGFFISNLAGLTANTPYYIRAYATNSAGTGYGNELIFTTLAEYSCGSSILINHIAGNVAPVTKTVNYGVVAGIPGEPAKCWITSNLGADHQAEAVTDGTEASAGWYWQFNLRQGFKHDGSARTPNIEWIGSISENSDWIPANDPCTLELGSGWRVPTYVEWLNVRTTSNWTNWNAPWSSDLKLHAVGYLLFYDGSLYYRGVHGYYWSSTQGDPGGGLYLDFFETGCTMWQIGKSFALPVRCVKEVQ
jgi:hypothetical protein